MSIPFLYVKVPAKLTARALNMFTRRRGKYPMRNDHGIRDLESAGFALSRFSEMSCISSSFEIRSALFALFRSAFFRFEFSDSASAAAVLCSDVIYQVCTGSQTMRNTVCQTMRQNAQQIREHNKFERSTKHFTDKTFHRQNESHKHKPA